METNKSKNIEYKLPDRVLDMIKDRLAYPSIIETDFYTMEALSNIIEKNHLLWSIKHFNGNTVVNKEGLIKFKDSNVYLYFIRRVDEEVYKFFNIFPETSSDSVIFYLNSLKQYKTI
jgi:hypothetical protein